MWFSIIPTYAIIVGSLAGPGYALWWVYYYSYGNHYKRAHFSRWERALYSRDWRLTGNPYIVKGLNDLPDK